jgi:hypothetical protein
MAGPNAVVLVRRADCGLCEELADGLSRLKVQFESVDIDERAELRQLYDDCVPVLLHEGRELARAPWDEQKLKRTLREAGVL